MFAMLAELQRGLIVANAAERLAPGRARLGRRMSMPIDGPDQAQLAQQLYDARQKTVQ